MDRIKFTVPGHPKGKARARTVRGRDGQTFSYTPEGTVLYENLVKTCYSQNCSFSFQNGEALDVHIHAFYDIPKSTSKKKREQMLSGDILPTKKPDIDKDALNGVAYHDDTQVVRLVTTKAYAEPPRVEVEIIAI